MHVRHIPTIMLLTVLCAGCGASRPEDPLPQVKATAKITLFSIWPEENDRLTNGAESFHDFRILGQVVIKDDIKKTIVEEIKSGIVEKTKAAKASSGDSVLPACWQPRHGLRFEQDGSVIDLVICFYCEYMHIHGLGNKQVRLTTELPKARLNKILADAGIPMAPGNH